MVYGCGHPGSTEDSWYVIPQNPTPRVVCQLKWVFSIMLARHLDTVDSGIKMGEKYQFVKWIPYSEKKNEAGIFKKYNNRKFYCIHIYINSYIRQCGEMDDRSDDSVCQDGQREIVYAWAMDADSRALPEGE